MLHNSVHNPEPSTQLSPCSLPTHQLPTKQPANNVAATHPYLSSLNTHFLLPTGDYNLVAASTLWYKASLFSFLPFMQKIQQLTAPDRWFDPTTCLIQSDQQQYHTGPHCPGLLHHPFEQQGLHAQSYHAGLADHQTASYSNITAIEKTCFLSVITLSLNRQRRPTLVHVN